MTIRTLFLLAMSFLVGSVNAQFVTLEGRDFKLDGADFYPMVMNYSVLYARSNSQPDNFPSQELYIAPNPSYGPTLKFDCDDVATCRDRILADLENIRDMGFNCIRLVGNMTVEYNDTPFLGSDERRYKIDVSQNPFPEYNHDENRILRDLEPGYSGPMALRHFQLINELLDLAAIADLKVIILAGGPARGWDENSGTRFMYQVVDQHAVDDYADYLGALAEAVEGHPAMLAIDVFNEPHFNRMQFNGCYYPNVEGCNDIPKLKKVEICNYTSQWYEAIKTADPNRLVTLGGSGVSDLEQWDPAVLHLDFYSLHIYPGPDYKQEWDYQEVLGRFHDDLYWFGQTSPMPWIIGETGFSANDRSDPIYKPHVGVEPIYHQWPYMHGSEFEQAEFATFSLEKARLSGASGWSWWDYQEVRWYDYYFPDDAFLHPEQMGTFFSMLHLGDANADWYYKPAIARVQDYVLAPMPNPPGDEPPNYANWNSLPGPITFSGTVVDQFSDPIKEAQVWLRQESIDNPDVFPNFDFDHRTIEHFHPAATNITGQFSFGTEPPSPGRYDPVRSNLIVVGTGTNVLGIGNWFGSTIEDNVTYLLTKDEFQYPGVVENESAMALDYPNESVFAGLQELRINNVETAINPNGWSADFVARQTVHATEFHAMHGTEVHLYTGPLFTDCDEGSYTMMTVNNDAATQATPKSNQQVAHTLQLQFTGPKDFQTTVFPNPFMDRLVVRVSNDAPVAVKLIDGLGHEIASWRFSNSKTIDFSDLASGPYLLRIIQGDRFNSHLVIKQPKP